MRLRCDCFVATSYEPETAGESVEMDRHQVPTGGRLQRLEPCEVARTVVVCSQTRYPPLPDAARGPDLATHLMLGWDIGHPRHVPGPNEASERVVCHNDRQRR
jgi:hypothetical protein